MYLFNKDGRAENKSINEKQEGPGKDNKISRSNMTKETKNQSKHFGE